MFCRAGRSVHVGIQSLRVMGRRPGGGSGSHRPLVGVCGRLLAVGPGREQGQAVAAGEGQVREALLAGGLRLWSGGGVQAAAVWGLCMWGPRHLGLCGGPCIPILPDDAAPWGAASLLDTVLAVCVLKDFLEGVGVSLQFISSTGREPRQVRAGGSQGRI